MQFLEGKHAIELELNEFVQSEKLQLQYRTRNNTVPASPKITQ